MQWSLIIAIQCGAWLGNGNIGVAQVAEPAKLASGTSGVLVLKNGNVIEGVIERVGDRYRVLVGRGEIGVPEHQVQMFASSRLDAYQQMKWRVRNTVLGHLEIAQWCIDQGLFAQAAGELVAAMKLEPKDPRIAALQRRLEVRARTAALSVSRPNSPGQPPGATPTPAQSNIALVANHETVEDAPKMSDQPPVVLEEFRRTVLPLMLNGCAANRCHGNSQAGGFALYQARNQHFSRRLVERNWTAVIEWLESDEPKSSTLLHRARTTHGRSETPPLAEDSEQYRRLADWVERQGVALKSQMKPATNNALAQHAAPTGFPPQTQAAPQQYPAVTSGSPIGSPPAAQVAPLGTPRIPRGAPGTAPKTLAHDDPFDPDVFNRHYHPKGKRLPPAGQ